MLPDLFASCERLDERVRACRVALEIALAFGDLAPMPKRPTDRPTPHSVPIPLHLYQEILDHLEALYTATMSMPGFGWGENGLPVPLDVSQTLKRLKELRYAKPLPHCAP